MPLPPASRLVLAAALALAPACGRCGSEDEAPPRADAAKPDAIDAKAQDDPAQATPVPADAAPAPPLLRAESPLSATAKAGKHMGYDFDALTGLYAQAGEVAAAPWSAEGGSDPALARDDDLRTAWTCTPTPEQPCAIGIARAEPLTVKALRLYTAHGPDWRDYTGGTKITEIRVHTDAGFVDVALEGDPQHEYVVFSEPITTRTLTVETRQTKPGKRGPAVAIAELEAFGAGGPKRPPLDLDPARSFVTYETQAWKPRGQDDHIVRIVFVEVLSPEGTPVRIARGSALLGRKGDRFLVVERLSTAKCDGQGGSWALLDQHTRMLLPLGTMGGVPATVRVLEGGLGVAFEHPTAMPHAVVIEDGVPKLKRPRKRDTDPAALLAKWGFAEAPALRRGGWRLPELPTGCESATSKAELLAGALGREAKPALPADFFVCRLTDTTSAILGSRGECGGDWSLAVVGPELTSTKADRRHARSPADARGIRVAPIDGGLLVEVSKEAGASANLYFLGSTLVEVAKGAGLAVHAPAVCDPCDDRFDRSTPLPVDATVVAEPGVVEDPTMPTDPADAPPDDGELPDVDAPEDEPEPEPEPEAEEPPPDEDAPDDGAETTPPAATERP